MAAKTESIPLGVGDRVEVYLDASNWQTSGWLPGTVSRVDPYTAHRSFHWVELDTPAVTTLGAATGVISILNPKNIRRA